MAPMETLSSELGNRLHPRRATASDRNPMKKQLSDKIAFAPLPVLFFATLALK